MKVLGIETSCDETAIAVLDIQDVNSVKVLSNVVSSQIKLHAEFGGVVPILAAREHTKNIRHVLDTALKNAGVTDIGKEIDLIAVTKGPGLAPALLIGITFAKTLAWKYNKPLIGTNHMKGHVYSNWLNEDFDATSIKFPLLNLVVSGNHTEIVLMKNYEDFELLGETMDDAVGEAFDKVARLLGLGYPGGPAIAKIATQGNPSRFPLPRPMLHSKNFDFSYSGLKTAVLCLTRDLKEKGVELDEQTRADIASSFQEAAIDVLIQKTIHAAKEYSVEAIFLSGGVSASTDLREKLRIAAGEIGLRYSRPPMAYTTDNATMIALAGYVAYEYEKTDTSWASVNMQANLGF